MDSTRDPESVVNFSDLQALQSDHEENDETYELHSDDDDERDLESLPKELLEKLAFARANPEPVYNEPSVEKELQYILGIRRPRKLKKQPVVKTPSKRSIPKLDRNDFTSINMDVRCDWAKAIKETGAAAYKFPDGISAAGHQVNNRLSELEIFKFLLNDSLKIFLHETNEQGWRIAEEKNKVLLERDRTKPLPSGKPRTPYIWREMFEAEMFNYLGLFFEQGLHNKPSNKCGNIFYFIHHSSFIIFLFRSYWALNPQDWTPVFPAVMSRRRFMEITEALHFQVRKIILACPML